MAEELMELVELQKEEGEKLEKLLNNYKKEGKDKKTVRRLGVITGKLEQIWKGFQGRNEEILARDDAKGSKYVSAGYYVKILRLHDELENRIKADMQKVAPAQAEHTNSTPTTSTQNSKALLLSQRKLLNFYLQKYAQPDVDTMSLAELERALETLSEQEQKCGRTFEQIRGSLTSDELEILQAEYTEWSDQTVEVAVRLEALRSEALRVQQMSASDEDSEDHIEEPIPSTSHSHLERAPLDASAPLTPVTSHSQPVSTQSLERVLNVHTEALEKLLQGQSNGPSLSSPTAPESQRDVKLPRISVPTFSGKVQRDWPKFRDLFVGIIHSNEKSLST